jgi:hypothetical protein
MAAERVVTVAKLINVVFQNDLRNLISQEVASGASHKFPFMIYKALDTLQTGYNLHSEK